MSLLLWLGCAASPLWTAQDRATLADSASHYWTYVRWGDLGHATVYLSTAEQRTAVANFSAAPPWRITEAEVLSAEVGSLLPKDLRPRSREGTVLVRIERYDERVGKVESSNIEQFWAKEGGRWRVDQKVAWGPGQLW
jgi:hypothetical protein